MSEEKLKSINSYPFFFFENDLDAENIINKMQTNEMKGAIRVIRGWKCPTKIELNNEVGAALQFPSYYGENWDAMDECIIDLQWIPADWYLVWINRIEAILKNNNKELETFLSVLIMASKYWNQDKGIPFNIIFSGSKNMIEEYKSIINQITK